MQCPTKNDQYAKTNGCLKHKKIIILSVTQFLDSLLAKEVNPEMLSTIRFYVRNAIYGS